MFMTASSVATADSNGLSRNHKKHCCMEQDADRATDERTVDADVLQVATDLVFNFLADFFRIPAFHDLGDQCRDLVSIATNYRVGEVQPPRVQFVLDSGLIPQSFAE